MLRVAYAGCVNNDADMCIFDIDIFCDGNINDRRMSNLTFYARKYITTYPLLVNPHTFKGIFIVNTTCSFNKLIKKEIIDKFQILFQNIPNANDISFAYLIAFFSKKIFFQDKALIHYRTKHYESITTQTKESYCACAIRNVHLVLSKKYYRESVLFLKQKLAFVYQTYHKLPNTLPIIDEAFAVFDNKNILNKDNTNSLQNGYYKELISKILNHDFDEPYINILWRYSRSKMLPYLQTFINQDKKIAIWGVGAIGKDLLKILKNENIPIHCFIDNNASIQNSYVEDILVKSFDDVKSITDLILISSVRAADDINKQIDYSKETLDIMSYMRFEIVEREVFYNDNGK